MGGDTESMNDFILTAETSVIGALLIDAHEASEALDRLSPEDFTDGYSKKAFEIIKAAAKEDKPFDAAIFSSTETDETLKQYVLAAAGSFISFANLSGYIQTIKDNARKRRIAADLENLLYFGQDPDTVLAELADIIDREQATDKPYQDEISARLIRYGEDIYKPFDPTTRIYTGYSRLDNVLCGLRKGSLSYIGAMPSTGKTALAMNILLKAIKEKRRVQFFSLEMSTEQLLDRMFAAALHYDIRKIDNKERQRTRRTG